MNVARKLVVILEREDVLAELLAGLLVDEGYEVAAVLSELRRPDDLSAYRPDLLLLDLDSVPRLVFSRLDTWLAHPAINGLRVLCLTTRALPEGMPALRQGVAVVSLPFDLDTLLEAIHGLADPEEP